jgi:hypothetical protein
MIIAMPAQCREQGLDALLERALALIVKTVLDLDDFASRVDQVRAGHVPHRVRQRCHARLVIGDGELRRVALEEACGVGRILVDVDRDDRQAAIAVATLQFVHPGKRAAARSAPRCPEVDVHHLPAQPFERQGIAVRIAQRERRRGIADSGSEGGVGSEGECDRQRRAAHHHRFGRNYLVAG